MWDSQGSLCRFELAEGQRWRVAEAAGLMGIRGCAWAGLRTVDVGRRVVDEKEEVGDY